MAVTELLSTIVFSSGSGARTATPNAGTATGDHMYLIAAFEDASSVTLTATGWTAVKTAFVTGTLKTSIYRRVRQSGDTTYSFTPSTSVTMAHYILTSKGWDAAVTPLAGADGTRAASGGTNLTTAPSLTTTLANMRVYVIGTERTNAAESGTPAVNNGFSLVGFGWDGALANPQSIYVGTKTQATAGAVGATTIGPYTNSNATNAYAVLLALAEAVTQYSAAGVTNIVTTSVGVVTKLTGASGAAAAVTTSEGTVAKRTTASGVTTVTSGSTGNATIQSGAVQHPAAGVSPVTSGSSGTVTKRTTVSGTAPVLSGTTGTVTAILGTSGTVDILTGTTGTVTLRTGASGAAHIITGSTGNATIAGPAHDFPARMTLTETHSQLRLREPTDLASLTGHTTTLLLRGN